MNLNKTNKMEGNKLLQKGAIGIKDEPARMASMQDVFEALHQLNSSTKSLSASSYNLKEMVFSPEESEFEDFDKLNAPQNIVEALLDLISCINNNVNRTHVNINAVEELLNTK